jgi:putative glutamine amidotransferase
MLHIPDDLPHALPHLDPLDPEHRHTLTLTPGTIMDRVYGDGELRVNSMHHMAVDEVAPGFKVSARCPDGGVEAIESDMDDWFAFGTQFHPEAATASALDMRIFEEFVTGVEQVRGGMRLVA